MPLSYLRSGYELSPYEMEARRAVDETAMRDPGSPP
jgi:hypothetical protein